MQPFWLALQFLTRLPAPRYEVVPPQAVGRSLLFYPLVGLIIGLLLYAVAQLMSAASPIFTAAMIVTLWLILSGALHIDGLSDLADAWVGGHGDRERTLAIMKDPYCGPMGVAAVVAVLLLKFTATTTLLSGAPHLLIVAPLAGRTLALLLMLTTPYVRESGLAAEMVRYMPRRALWGITILVTALVIYQWPWQGGWIVGASLLLFIAFRHALLQRLHGFSGDAAGALIELTEVVALLCGALLIP